MLEVEPSVQRGCVAVQPGTGSGRHGNNAVASLQKHSLGGSTIDRTPYLCSICTEYHCRTAIGENVSFRSDIRTIPSACTTTLLTQPVYANDEKCKVTFLIS